MEGSRGEREGVEVKEGEREGVSKRSTNYNSTTYHIL